MSVQRKRVLFMISSLSTGGAEKLLINLVNRFDRTRFAVDVVALSNNNPLAQEIQPRQSRFTALPRTWRYDLRPVRRIQQIVLDGGIDAVIAFDLFTYFYARLALRGMRQRPRLLVSLHATNPKSIKHYLQTMLYARLPAGDEQFISVCNMQADYLSRTYGIARKRFVTVYNGIDVEHFCPAGQGVRNSMRASLAIPEDAFVIIQVASLAPHKHHENSLAALREVITRQPGSPCWLLLVGQGPKDREDKLRRMAEGLGISDRVSFCGLQGDVRPYYQAADLFTLSSRSIETFSIAALEAMSMGLPCVLTDVGGAREMIVDGLNGYLVPARDPHALADAWWRAMEQRACFDRRQIRAWVVDHFSLTDCVEKYEDLV